MKNIFKTKTCKIILIILVSAIAISSFSVGIVGYVYSNRKTAVVVIPGLLCSAIQDVDNGDIYYDPIDSDTYGFSFDTLSTNKIYSMIFDIVTKTDILSQLNDVLDNAGDTFLDKFELNEKGEPIYNSAAIQWDHDGYAKYGAMTVMKNPYDYFYNRFKDKKNYDTFVFQYDWRRDNRIAAEQLVEATKEYDDVIIVAHSMGNIVTSLALANFESFRKKVILNCSYAAPYLGSYSALNILEYGEKTVDDLLAMGGDFVENISIKAVKTMLGNLLDNATTVCHERVLPIFRKMPGIVQLLPTIDIVCPDGVNSSITVNGTPITTKEQLLNYYKSCFWAHENNDLNNPIRPWVDDLDEYWNSFYVNGVHASQLVNTYYFAGVDVNTVNSANITKDENQIVTSFVTTSDRGDGTVLYSSASLGLNEKVLDTEGYIHTALGTAFVENLVTSQTEEALESINTPFKVLSNKPKK